MIYTLVYFNYAAIIAIHAMFSPSLFGIKIHKIQDTRNFISCRLTLTNNIIAFSLADRHHANRFAEDTIRKIQYGRLIFCSGTNKNTYCFFISRVSVS